MEQWLMVAGLTLCNTFWMFFLTWEPAQRKREAEAERVARDEWRGERFKSIEDFYFWHFTRSYE